ASTAAATPTPRPRRATRRSWARGTATALPPPPPWRRTCGAGGAARGCCGGLWPAKAANAATAQRRRRRSFWTKSSCGKCSAKVPWRRQLSRKAAPGGRSADCWTRLRTRSTAQSCCGTSTRAGRKNRWTCRWTRGAGGRLRVWGR
ncbi:unnamed protein product, partial [Effrenium voratum]